MNMNNEKRVCSICGYPIEKGNGHNPWPVMDRINDGPCCDLCDDYIIGPAQREVSKKLAELMDEAGMSRSEADSYLDDFISTDVMSRVEILTEDVKRMQEENATR